MDLSQMALLNLPVGREELPLALKPVLSTRVDADTLKPKEDWYEKALMDGFVGNIGRFVDGGSVCCRRRH
jgi:hypothetical protein